MVDKKNDQCWFHGCRRKWVEVTVYRGRRVQACKVHKTYK